MKYLRKPQIEQAKREVAKFNPAFFDLQELWDYFYNKFDLFCVQDAEHFVDDHNNAYLEVMRGIQTKATVIFFVMIHIPLSRMHSSFSFLTALIPIMLNIRTKYYFYEKSNRFVCWIINKFMDDPEAINHIKRPSHIKYQEETVLSMDSMGKTKKDFSMYLNLSREETDN